jgi:hypothetical protein
MGKLASKPCAAEPQDRPQCNLSGERHELIAPETAGEVPISHAVDVSRKEGRSSYTDPKSFRHQS